LNVIGIVPEPVAAVLHYGFTGNAKDEILLVYDLGGGTFDISLIRMTDGSAEVLTVGGDHRLGGAGWDERLLDYIVEQVIAQCGDESLLEDEAMLQELRTLAEKTKKELSVAQTKTILVTTPDAL
jgi:molecular chaperone DnaK